MTRSTILVDKSTQLVLLCCKVGTILVPMKELFFSMWHRTVDEEVTTWIVATMISLTCVDLCTWLARNMLRGKLDVRHDLRGEARGNGVSHDALHH